MMPSRMPSSHSEAIGMFAHRKTASTIPTSPLASTQPQLGKGLMVSAKMILEMPSTMKKTISSTVMRRSPLSG